MKNIGYYNGQIAPLEELMIPALDRAVYFGDGCYEALYLVNGVLFGLEARLPDSDNDYLIYGASPRFVLENPQL